MIDRWCSSVVDEMALVNEWKFTRGISKLDKPVKAVFNSVLRKRSEPTLYNSIQSTVI